MLLHMQHEIFPKTLDNGDFNVFNIYFICQTAMIYLFKM